MKTYCAAASILLLCAGTSACDSSDSSETASSFEAVFEPGACPFDMPDGGIEGENVHCGTVRVPVRWSEPAGPTLELAVVRVRADAAEPAPDPLFMLTGGAGGSAILAFLDGILSPVGTPLRAPRDTVLFDQRGAGYSRPFLGCPEYVNAGNDALGANVPLEEARAADEGALKECHDRLAADGIDLDAFNSVENAADVPAVVHALGYKTYNVYGLSYGTLRTQHLLRDAPQGIRSVLLDSTAPLEAPLYQTAARHAQDSIELVFTRCAADATCAAAYPDLQATLLTLLDELDANPVTLDTVNPLDGQPMTMTFRGTDLISFLINLMQPDGIPSIPYAIAQMAQGDFSLAAESYPAFNVRNTTYSDGMETSFQCTEAMDFPVEDIVLDDVWPEVDDLVAGQVRNNASVCEHAWPAELIDESKRQQVTSDVPALLMVGDYDVTTPPSFAEIAHTNLTSSQLYQFDGVGHGVIGECAIALMASFLEDPTREPDHTCVDALTVNFVIP